MILSIRTCNTIKNIDLYLTIKVFKRKVKKSSNLIVLYAVKLFNKVAKYYFETFKDLDSNIFEFLPIE